ncbi:uncharacterized protein LOC144903546 isoform X2 [Branchiostoma floridae x Branchiostoma belcheri]
MWSTGGQVLSLVLTAVAVILVPSADCSAPPPEIQDEVNKCMLTLGLHKVIPHISSVKMAMDFCMAKVARAQSDGFQRTVKNSYQSPSSYSQQQSPYSNSQQSSFPQQSSQVAYMTNAISPPQPPPPPPPKCVADFSHCGYCECNCCSGKCELSWLLWEASVCVPENKCTYSRVTKCVNQKKISH